MSFAGISKLQWQEDPLEVLRKWQNDFSLVVLGEMAELKGAIPAGELTLAEAGQVYRQGYCARLIDALGQIFESVWGVLGDEDFYKLCEAFISKERSLSYNINHYKISFIDFVGTHKSAEYAFIRDLAALDWYYNELFHQKTEFGLTGEQLSERLQGGEVQRVQLISSFKLVFSQFHLASIYQAARQNQAIEVREIIEGTCTLMSKSAGGISLLEIDLQIGRAIQKMIQGEELTVAVEELSSDQISSLFELLAKARLALTLH